MQTHKIIFLVLFFLLAGTGFGQKQMQYRIPSEELKGIYIDSDEVFQIRVQASKIQEFKITAEVEGETFESVLVDPKQENDLWRIYIKRSIGFKAFDDKLAAHKVISIVLNIEMPENKELWVRSSLASLWAEGTFKYLNVNLMSGDCNLINYLGDGVINTLRGSIYIETSNAQVEAISRNGNNETENKSDGKYHLKLKSVDGNIRVSQSQ
ncbi:hypothetical protein [Leeuwenhoekiella sp. LLG6367-2.1]|uniref:hypothetical protein n=1 Tax=Leeuwenhoekiella sp. LLG6367-2.1 TaxID=3160833 RepID=UPI003865F045